MVAPQPVTKKFPLIAWLAVITVVLILVLLALPSQRQKRVNTALEYLATDYACPPELAKQVLAGDFSGTALPGKPPTRRRIRIWNPSPKVPATDYSFRLNVLSIAWSNSSTPGDGNFLDSSIVFAPTDNYYDHEVLARAYMQWTKDKGMARQLDEWSVKFANSSTHTKTVNHIRRALMKLAPEEQAELDRMLAKNRKLCAGLDQGTVFFIDDANRVYKSTTSEEYAFETNWDIVNGRY